MSHTPQAERASAAPERHRPVDRLIVHCSATPNGRWTTTADVDRWHAERGFNRRPCWRARQNMSLGAIGYHFLLYTNGAIATGRHLDEVGAHARGYNAHSIGICMVGTDRFTAAQWRSLAAVVHTLVRWVAEARGLRHGLRAEASAAALLCLAAQMRLRITGHRDLSPDRDGDGVVEPHEWLKTCPGFDVAGWLVGGMQPLADHLLPVIDTQPPSP